MTRRQVIPLLGTAWFEQDTASAERRLFELINEARTDRNLQALQWSDALNLTCRNHSRRMMELGFFSHIDPEFGSHADRLNAAGISWVRCAENIFHSYGWENPIRHALINWMYSPGHRDNILIDEVTHSAIGIARRASNHWYITQQFVLFRTGIKGSGR